MADAKISALTGATTPLAGTEVVPLVQAGVTKNVSISNLTTGRDVSVAGVTVSAGTGFEGSMTQNTTNGLSIRGSSGGVTNSFVLKNAGGSTVLACPAGTTTLSAAAAFNVAGLLTPSGGVTGFAFTGGTAGEATITSGATNGLTLRGLSSASTNEFYINGSGGALILRVPTGTQNIVHGGNWTQGTAAKGIDFTANTPVAGMTSQLLNWYEEGTWTPNQGAGLTVVGAFTSNGTYVRIGRSVTVKGQVLGATTVAVAAAGVISTNLPFAAASGHAGSMYNAAITVGGVVAITTSSVTAADAMAATASITFTATYQV